MWCWLDPLGLTSRVGRAIEQWRDRKLIVSPGEEDPRFSPCMEIMMCTKTVGRRLVRQPPARSKLPASLACGLSRHAHLRLDERMRGGLGSLKMSYGRPLLQIRQDEIGPARPTVPALPDVGKRPVLPLVLQRGRSSCSCKSALRAGSGPCGLLLRA